jgi:hypothetical protein
VGTCVHIDCQILSPDHWLPSDFSHGKHELTESRDRVLTISDCNIQFPVPSTSPPSVHLHQYICTLNHAWHHGQKQRRVILVHHSLTRLLFTYVVSSFLGIFWKCARVGERLSPYISICCILMAVSGACALFQSHANQDTRQFSLFMGY